MQTGAGYGAFNFLTPSESLSDAARASSATLGSQLEAATLPDKIQQSANATAQSGINLSEAQTAKLVKDKAAHQALIANAAALAQDADSWDAQMQDLVDAGVPEARQFVGRYSTGLQGRVAKGYSAGTPGAALTEMLSENPTGVGEAQSGMAPVAGGSGAGVAEGVDYSNFDKLFANQTPQQVQAAYKNAEAVRNGLKAISESATPAQTWDQQVALLGHPEWRGQYSPLRMQQLAQEFVPMDNYLRGRMAREQAAIPLPQRDVVVDKLAGGELASIDMSDPQHPKATILGGGRAQFIGTNDKGHAIYYDPVAKKEIEGSADLSTSRYSRMNNTVYAQKQAAWLQAHPGDTQGALDYAGGKQGKALTPQQVQMAAASQAARNLAALATAGTPPADADLYLQQQEQEISTALTQAGSGPGAPPPAAAGPATPPTSALAKLVEGQPTTFANHQVWTKKNGKPVRLK